MNVNVLKDEEYIKIAWAAVNSLPENDKDEAFSVSLVGVAKAVKYYSPDFNTKLSTFCFICARREIIKEIEKACTKKRGRGMTRIPFDTLENYAYNLIDKIDDFLDSGGTMNNLKRRDD